MNSSLAIFVVLPSDVAEDIAGLANAHAAYDLQRRRVVRVDDAAEWPPKVVALTMRLDGTICALLTRSQALDECWIEEGFLRATYTTRA